MYQVKIGFVPSYRFRYTPWAQKMLDDSLTTFAQVEGMQVVAPGVLPEGEAMDEEKGQTPHGMVHSLDLQQILDCLPEIRIIRLQIGISVFRCREGSLCRS